MAYKLETLNKGEIEVESNKDNTVTIGNLTVPIVDFVRFTGELMRNKNSERSLFVGDKEVKGMLKYPQRFSPVKVRFGEYEIDGKYFGTLAERLVEGVRAKLE